MPFGIRRFGSSSRFLQRFCVFALRLPLFRLIYVSATSLIEHKRNIFSRLVEPFSPSRFSRYFDDSLLIRTPPLVRSHGISLQSFLVYPPNLRIRVTVAFLDFVTLGPLIRRIRLNIGFLFVRLRFCYPFLSPAPHGTNLGSRSGVRRQLRPSRTLTTDRRHARRT